MRANMQRRLGRKDLSTWPAKSAVKWPRELRAHHSCIRAVPRRRSAQRVQHAKGSLTYHVGRERFDVSGGRSACFGPGDAELSYVKSLIRESQSWFIAADTKAPVYAAKLSFSTAKIQVSPTV
jgi:hypothetical protein